MQCNVNQSKHDNGRFMRTLTNVSVFKYSFSIKFIAKFFYRQKMFRIFFEFQWNFPYKTEWHQLLFKSTKNEKNSLNFRE